MGNRILELTPGLLFIGGEQNGKFPYSNSLFLSSQKANILVDTGVGKQVLQYLAERYDIDIIINTHFHIDHIHGNRFFPQAEIWAHFLDVPALEKEEEFHRFCGFSRINQETVKEYFFHITEDLQRRPVSRTLADGEVLDLGDMVWRVIHTPGHTPGHIALYEVNRKILFAGDIDLSSFGPWYGNSCSDLQDFLASLEKLEKLEIKFLVSSHTEPVKTEIKERLENYKAIISKREERILHYIEEEKTMEECLKEHLIQRHYPEPKEIYRFFEKMMLEKHLERLISQGKVVLEGNGKYKLI
jgi:glyoxylase-like metal-dependent hydrolase (beta-lactamase superfamily II)